VPGGVSRVVDDVAARVLYALLQHPAQLVEWLREVEPSAVVDVPSADPSDDDSAGLRRVNDGDGAADGASDRCFPATRGGRYEVKP
jgi:hypothetical protein